MERMLFWNHTHFFHILYVFGKCVLCYIAVVFGSNGQVDGSMDEYVFSFSDYI